MTDMIQSLGDGAQALLDRLGEANRAFATKYPGDRADRQPVHTVYGGAQLFRAETPAKLGQLATRAMGAYAPDAETFAHALALPGHEALPTDDAGRQALAARFAADAEGLREADYGAWLAYTVYTRVQEKLAREAVEDFRIDFEDGFGARPDAEEDAEAARTAREVARGMAEGTLPPFIGIRIKTFSEEFKARATRTLDIFVSTLCDTSGGRLPEGFVVTLPKVTIPEQVSTLVGLLEALEVKLGLGAGALKLELMVETTQSLFDDQGRAQLPILVAAAGGRCVGAHFGTYDYTASCSITAAHQSMDHPACDFARSMMTVCLGGTGVFLSDGATNVMPVGPHRAPKGEALTDAQAAENRAVVHGAWKLAYDHTRHSLRGGIYQGWDLHPAQLPIRYAACYAFFLEGFGAAALRLRNFVDQAAQATLVGDVFDDAATGQGLLNYFLRARNCGAVSEAELALTGLTEEELQIRSFARILAARRARLAAG